MATHTAIKDAYMLGNGIRESCRLYLQHYIWGEQVGWHMHPKIKESAPEAGFKVVDVGCGNGTWILDIARRSPPSWTFLGLDISPANFPDPADLPPNVRFQVTDVFDTIPADLYESFDALHVGIFAVVVKGGDASPLCTNLLNLLRPGGLFQWDEYDCATFWPQAPRPGVDMSVAQDVMERWHAAAAKAGLQFGWISELSAVMEKQNMEVVDSFRQTVRSDLRKAVTDNLVTALDGVGHMWSQQDPTLVGTPEEWQKRFQGMIEEVGKGVTLSANVICCVGKKQLRDNASNGATTNGST